MLGSFEKISEVTLVFRKSPSHRTNSSSSSARAPSVGISAPLFEPTSVYGSLLEWSAAGGAIGLDKLVSTWFFINLI